MMKEKPELKATVLTDNTEYENLKAEWGLAIYIEYKGKKILLDTGSSPLYAENAEKLGISLPGVDFAVLSHAHFDHANGMPVFFGINSKAPFYLCEGCHENCYSMDPRTGKHYIGIPQNTLADFKDRILYAKGKTEISEGVYLLSHSTKELGEIGKREWLFAEFDGAMIPDDFSHEQSLVFKTEKGLVIFNSCCHAGAYNIINEVSEAFPGEKIAGLIGGFHLFNRSDEEVKAFAEKLKACGADYICTGHCTGPKALDILEDELGPAMHRLRCGLVMEW